MSSPGRKRPRPRYRPGFWARPEVRRYLPVAIGALAMVLLALTLAVAPRGRRRQTAPPAAGAAEPEPAAISEERVELRRDSDSRSESIITLGRGSSVTIEEQRGTWCRVRDRSGREGWLPRHAVERDADRTLRARRAETIFRFVPLSGDVEEDTPLLLAPFSFAAVWGEAERGASLDVYSVDHGYYATKLPDGTLGFVASEDVDIIPANPAEPALTPGAGKVVRGISVAEQAPPPPAAAPEPPAPGGPVFPGMPEDVPAPGPPPSNVAAGGAAGAEVAPAVLVQKVDPVYPPAALAAHVAGTVVLQVSIDRDGNVVKVRPTRQAPLGMTEAAIAAVERWKYRPATALGGPIPSMKYVRIEFKPPQ